MTDIIHLEALLQFEYERLEKEHKKLMQHFLKNKKCDCLNHYCKHFKRIEKKYFGKKFYNLTLQGTALNALSMQELIIPNH